MMVRKLFFILLFTIVLLPAAQMVYTLEPMPNTAGFSGFVRPGYGYLDPSSITKCNTEENRVSFVYENNI